MATAWQTLEEAALTLGISSRTLHRKIVKGKYQSRLENGRREVLVSIEEPQFAPETQVSDDSADMADISAVLDSHSTEAHSESPQDMSDDIGSTMLALHEDRIRRTDLAIMAYQQSVNVTAANARRTHRNARLAWSVAGGLAIATFLAAIWATHSVTQAQGEVTRLTTAVRQLSDTSDAKTREADKFRVDAETAKLAAAKMEGQLDAAKSRIDQLTAEQTALQSKVAIQVAAPILASSITPAATQPATTQPITSADSPQRL